MPKSQIENVKDIVGFFTKDVKPGEMTEVLTRSTLVSDEPEFYQYIEQFSNIYLYGYQIDDISKFLVLIHKDKTAEVYINDFVVEMMIAAKKDIAAGELVRKDDIADIQRLRFSRINISQDDKVIVCLKVGWKFGLFFDFDRSSKLDTDAKEKDLGSLYRYLFFQYVYEVLEKDSDFRKMMMDGWFPFIEIIANEYKQLCEIYKKESIPKEAVEILFDNFTDERLDKITSKWWKHQIFIEKKDILQPGINSYKNGDYVSCIKNLITEIEGILRLSYLSEKQTGNVPNKVLGTFLLSKAVKRAGSDNSLLLPKHFIDYIKDIIFSSFNIDAGDLQFSRNTATHGVARFDEYTKLRALQIILSIDQMYYYLI